MVKVRLKRQSRGRTAGVGLALSMVLILGAIGIIRSSAEAPSADPHHSGAEVVLPGAPRDAAVSPDVTPSDPSKGQRAKGRRPAGLGGKARRDNSQVL